MKTKIHPFILAFVIVPLVVVLFIHWYRRRKEKPVVRREWFEGLELDVKVDVPINCLNCGAPVVNRKVCEYCKTNYTNVVV